MSDVDRYFATDPSLAAAAGSGGMYVEVERDIAAVEFVPGLAFRPVVGQELMANYVWFDPNTTAPVHAHEEEQITLVIAGELEYELAGEVRMLHAGMAAVVPPGVPHGARTRDGTCLEIDVFHPPRRALLELMRSREDQGPTDPGGPSAPGS